MVGYQWLWCHYSIAPNITVIVIYELTKKDYQQ